jgi:hypothetical protein
MDLPQPNNKDVEEPSVKTPYHPHQQSGITNRYPKQQAKPRGV